MIKLLVIGKMSIRFTSLRNLALLETVFSGGLTAADSLFNGKVLIGDPNSKDCNAACKSKKFAFGQTIGTGPFCASSCTDCPKGSKCLDNWAEGGLCVFGHKVCCCLKAKKVTRKLDIYNELLGRDSFDSRNNEDSNDESDE
ncbi:hypothetical protein I4U23_017866 [Adineta vaga]|nr:hypothetical protein I4U23_017866 [Adineta vaga]